MYRCELCIGIDSTLRHPHALYIRARSRAELEAISERLLRISQPYAGGFNQSGDASWSLTFWYTAITHELLRLVASLPFRYTLQDLHLDDDTLTFWPGDTEPKGALGPLIKMILAGEKA